MSGRSPTIPLDDLVGYIDWTPFFATWELNGLYPQILDDPVVGAAARSLHADALALLDRIVADKRLRADAVVGFWPANSIGDDIELYTDADAVRSGRHDPHAPPADGQAAGPPEPGPGRLHDAPRVRPDRLRRRRSRSRPGTSSRSSSPRPRPRTTTTPRSWPVPWPTAWPRRSPSASTRWSAASCGATRPTRRLTNDDLIAERYQGIRPAPGYPACPDHTEKGPLFELLDAEARAGIRLTESFAMWPGAAVSGYYFWNPQSTTSALGRIGRDQLDDYAHRKGVPVEVMARWLSPNLADD